MQQNPRPGPLQLNTTVNRWRLFAAGGSWFPVVSRSNSSTLFMLGTIIRQVQSLYSTVHVNRTGTVQYIKCTVGLAVSALSLVFWVPLYCRHLLKSMNE